MNNQFFLVSAFGPLEDKVYFQSQIAKTVLSHIPDPTKDCLLKGWLDTRVKDLVEKGNYTNSDIGCTFCNAQEKGLVEGLDLKCLF